MREYTLEDKIGNLVKKCTEGFRQHPNFKNWQHERIWQEKFQEKLIEELEKFVSDLGVRKIIEIGSGMGGFLVAMKQRGYDIVGIEPRQDYRKISLLRAKRYSLDIDVREAQGESLPFKDGLVDFITAKDVIEHCNNPKRLLHECFRVLSRGGKMYITVPNRFGLEDPHYFLYFINWLPRPLAEVYIRMRGKKKESSLDRQKLSDMHYFTYGQFMNLVYNIGFNVCDINGEKMNDYALIHSSFRRSLIKNARIFRIDRILYKVARTFYLPVFQFILEKDRG